MAASSMGAFGTYKTQYHRHFQYEREARERAARQLRHQYQQQQQPPGVETVWITKRYDPLDPRVLAPVPRYKLVVKRLPTPTERYWVPVTEPPLRSFERVHSDVRLASAPSTRDEHWSTLKQMLPSRGSAHKVLSPSWGLGQGPPPFMDMTQVPGRFPKVNSAMTRYVDHMWTTSPISKYQ